MTRCWRVAAAAAVVLLALPGAAAAATVSAGGGAVTFTAASGESNRLSVSAANGALRFEDFGVSSMTAGPGCTSAGARRVDCASAGIGGVTVELGDGDDAITSRLALPFGVYGGLGDDRIALSAGGDAVDGGAGADTIDTGSGDDALDGGGGADSLSAGPGADTVRALDGAADALACGSEHDVVEADRDDAADLDCELVHRAKASPTGIEPPTLAPVLPPAPTGGMGSVIEAPVAAISGAPLVVTDTGATAIRLKCPRVAFEGCAGSLAIDALGVAGPRSRLDVAATGRGPRVLATLRFRAAAGAGVTVPVHMEPRGWRRLRARRHMRVRATVTMGNAVGTTSSTRTVPVRRAG
jgi:hypothetical protein